MIIDPELLRIANSVTQKRPKTVIKHIIKHGFITNDDLKDTYGYNHPPRAIRDVREQGIPVETYRIEGRDGRKIGAYRFGDPKNIESHKLGGRKTFSKQFKQALVTYYGEKCMISSERYEERYLQIDHRIPYQVSGDMVSAEGDVTKFMLLSGTAQRQKSWSCEHCENLLTIKDISICANCYWASPEKYTHVAMKQERQINLTFSGENVALFDKMEADAAIGCDTIQDFIFKKLKG
jgi:hypothetical protein